VPEILTPSTHPFTATAVNTDTYNKQYHKLLPTCRQHAVSESWPEISDQTTQNTPVERPACTVHTGSEPLHITTRSTSLVKKDPLGILSRLYFSQNPSSSNLEAAQRVNVGLGVKVKVCNCQIPRVRP